ncbi:MAG: phage integrase SAM-like domain-containing protein, partial [Eubacterium sp.]
DYTFLYVFLYCLNIQTINDLGSFRFIWFSFVFKKFVCKFVCNYFYIQIMSLTVKTSFKPEKRKNRKTGETITQNVSLLMDISFRGRVWYRTGFKLGDASDFDVTTQRLKAGKKAFKDKMKISATNVNAELDKLKGNANNVFSTTKVLIAQGKDIDLTAAYILDAMRKLSGDGKQECIITETFIDGFSSAIEKWYKLNVIGHRRKAHYDVLLRDLERFFRILKKPNLSIKSFDVDILVKFQEFLFDEHNIMDKYPSVYADISEKSKPKARQQNTVAGKLKCLKTYFNELDEMGKISINPFRRIAKKERQAMMRESYDEPVNLKLDELLKIVNGEVPETMERVKDNFLLQVATGIRIDDFMRLTWAHIDSSYGFYSVHYVAEKTSHKGDLSAINTPLVKFAADIIEKYKNKLPSGYLVPYFIGNVSGKDGYNNQIKSLFNFFGIGRTVIVRKDGKLIPIAIKDIASSKVARATHVDVTTKLELNKYLSGLHRVGSDAVNAYTGLSLTDKFNLYCMAFQQPEYQIVNS